MSPHTTDPARPPLRVPIETTGTGWPRRFRRELFEPILHGVAQTLRCNSASLAVIDEDEQALAIAVGCTAEGGEKLPTVEEALGFAVSGVKIPLLLTDSLFVRALREERLLSTDEITELAGGALPEEVVAQVKQIIGPRSFAVVPVLGQARALGVLLVERLGRGGFLAPERELLLSYAERLGSELESELLQATASRLDRLGQTTVPPPSLLFARLVGSPENPHFVCVGGSRHGEPLAEALRVQKEAAFLGSDLLDRLRSRDSVTLTLSSEVPSVVADLTLPAPLRVTLRLVPGSQGEPTDDTLITVAVEDLGWTRELRRDLVLAKERLAKVMGSIGDAVLTLDRDGAILQANEASQTVLGCGPQTLLGSPGLDLAATPRARLQLHGLSARLKETGFAEVEVRIIRRSIDERTSKPGARKPSFLARLSALRLCDEAGAPAGAVWHIQDQTDRRREAAEQNRLRLRLMQSERLSALGEMAARIAHEVRNPLVSIGAAAQVVAEELPPDSSVRREALAIGQEVRRLDDILNNVLRLARPSQALAKRCEVGGVVAQVAELLNKNAEGLSLSVSLPPEVKLVAMIDGDQLKQVLWNLLKNACDAARLSLAKPVASGGPQGTHLIECAVRGVRSQPTEAAKPRTGQGPRVLITIADRGPGIPIPLRRRVFDPFFSTKTRGTGLGLSISKQIIEEAGGRIRLFNRSGGGTRVTVELPRGD